MLPGIVLVCETKTEQGKHESNVNETWPLAQPQIGGDDALVPNRPVRRLHGSPARGIWPGAYRGAGNVPACPQLRPHCQPVRSVAFVS